LASLNIVKGWRVGVTEFWSIGGLDPASWDYAGTRRWRVGVLDYWRVGSGFVQGLRRDRRWKFGGLELYDLTAMDNE
jgi:hypothetical protein